MVQRVGFFGALGRIDCCLCREPPKQGQTMRTGKMRAKKTRAVSCAGWNPPRWWRRQTPLYM